MGHGTRSANYRGGYKSMKITLEIVLDGNMVLPVSAEVDTLSDLAKLGKKLAALPGNSNKLIPGTGERKVERLRFAKE